MAEPTPAAATNDLVVVLPGIMGSSLYRGETPVWDVRPGALARAWSGLGSLALPPGVGDEAPRDGIEPRAPIESLHAIPGLWTPVKGYGELVGFLGTLGYSPERGNLLVFAYDWRLSNRYTARRLKQVAEPALERLRSRGGQYSDARFTFICHSMGGLVARWYVEQEQGHELTRKLITLGTPWRGAAKAAYQLVNGAPRKLGPLKDRVDAVVQSLPSMYQLLPEYACLTAGSGLETVVEQGLPGLARDRVADGFAFHTALRVAEEARPAPALTHVVLGSQQPTLTTLTVTADGSVTGHETILGQDYRGDGTVPLPGGLRTGLDADSPLLHHIPDAHGNLQRNKAAWAQIEGALTGVAVRFKDGGDLQPQVRVEDVFVVGESPRVEVDLTVNAVLDVALTDDSGQPVQTRTVTRRGHAVAVSFDPVPPGGYSVTVRGHQRGDVAAVTHHVVVCDPADAEP